MQKTDKIKDWYYLLPDGTTVPNMKKLKEITGKSITTLRSLIRKEEIKKIYTKQMLRSYDTTEELRAC